MYRDIFLAHICTYDLFNASKRNETKLNKFTPKIILAMEHRGVVRYMLCMVSQKQHKLLRHLPCLLQSQVGKILLHFDELFHQSESSLPPTSCLFRYLIRFINIPQFDKHLHYRLAEFCAKFYISSNFFNILNRFLTILLTVVNV